MQEGIVVPVFDKLRLDYTYLAMNASESVRLISSIPVAAFYHVRLIIRIHALTISSGQSFGFSLVNTLPSDHDPREFSDTSTGAGNPFLTVTINSSSPSPPTIVMGNATDPGAFLKLTMTATQGATPSVPLYGEFSGVCVLRPL